MAAVPTTWCPWCLPDVIAPLTWRARVSGFIEGVCARCDHVEQHTASEIRERWQYERAAAQDPRGPIR